MSFTSELPGRNDRWTFIFMYRSASTYAHWCSFPSFFGWYLDQPKKYLIHFLYPSKLFNAFKRHFEEIKIILQLKATVINKPNTSINLLKYKFSNLCLRKVVIIYRKIKLYLVSRMMPLYEWNKLSKTLKSANLHSVNAWTKRTIRIKILVRIFKDYSNSNKNKAVWKINLFIFFF